MADPGAVGAGTNPNAAAHPKDATTPEDQPGSPYSLGTEATTSNNLRKEKTNHAVPKLDQDEDEDDGAPKKQKQPGLVSRVSTKLGLDAGTAITMFK